MSNGSVRSQPLVSVVIPTYNRADYIADTIESVLGQTYQNIEIIVIDDESTDNSREVVSRYEPRVRYVWQKNAERGASRNHGLRLAKGEYISFLDSDDVWVSRMVEESVVILEANPEVGLVYCDATQIDSGGRELRVLRAAGPSGQVTARLLERNLVMMGAHLARTAPVRETGGFREERQLSGSEDWELWVRLSLRTQFAYLPVTGAKIRTHAGNTMTNADAMRRSMGRASELFHQSEDLAAFAKSLRRMDSNIALVNAINYCSQGDWRETLSFLAKAAKTSSGIIFDPRFSYTIVRLLKIRTIGPRGNR